jgi:acylphosphatase
LQRITDNPGSYLLNERLEAIASGRVQLVMYRDFVKRGARKLGLTGEVRNLADGTVRVIAEGPREKLEVFIARLRRGSLLSHVENVSTGFSSATGAYSAFDITYG